jgi:hypothetical protein
MSEDLQNDIEAARKMSMPELLRWTKGWKESSAKNLVGQLEIARRERKWPERRAWIALVVSLISLVLSILAMSAKA